MHSDPSDFQAQYLNGILHDFYALAHGALDSALEQPRSLSHGALQDALFKYAKKLQAPDASLHNIGLLAQPRTRAVVTGQQAGLLLGPTFTLSKAITAIKLAKRLSQTERPVIPVFWVASQDHDTEEMRRAHLLDFEENLHSLDLPLPEAVPAGRIAMTGEYLATTLAGLSHVTGPGLPKVTSLLQATAEYAKTYADWFAAMLYQFLGKEGLVVLNPLDEATARLFSPILKQELLEPTASVKAINQAGQALRKRGFEPQLGRAQGATNLFIEELQGDLPRRRLLRFDGAGFFTEHCRYSEDHLLYKLENHPGSITPAAGLRPITQDAVLPTAVTVVGPGELRYFAQLRGVYEHHQVAMPLIYPRASITVLEPPVSRILHKFKLSPGELRPDLQGFKDHVLLQLHGHGSSFDSKLAELGESIQQLLAEVRSVDPTLEGSVLRAERILRKSITTLQSKTARALSEQDSIYSRQFTRLEAHLYPLGQPQERLISPFSFFIKFGIEPVLDKLLSIDAEGEQFLSI